MVFWIASAVGLAIAYLFGSTPTGYLAGKLLRGIDIREHGSKSTGATNVLRTLGKWPALAVLLVDVLKGVAAKLLHRLTPWWKATRITEPTIRNNPITSRTRPRTKEIQSIRIDNFAADIRLTSLRDSLSRNRVVFSAMTE